MIRDTRYPLTTWAIRSMTEIRSLTEARHAKGRVAPSEATLRWAELVMRAARLPKLPTPQALLTYHPRQPVELIWPEHDIRALLRPPFGWGWWPVMPRAWRLRHKLLRHCPEAR